MDDVLRRLKPTRGFSSVAHNSLLVVLPLIIFALVRLNQNQFTQLAVALVVLSKWRMFAVRPRFWLANIRANGIDLIVGISVVIFMLHSSIAWIQFIWAIAYGAWLIYLKPANGGLMISVQAGIGQLAGLSALYLSFSSAPIYGLTLLTGLISFLAARHFFDAFEESYSRLLSYLWGYFAASIAWVLSHWLLYYGVFSQPTILLISIGYGIAALYYLDHNNKLNRALKQQIIAVMLLIVLVVIIFSDWGSKVV